MHGISARNLRRLAVVLSILAAGVPAAQAGVNGWTPLGPDGGFTGELFVEPGTNAVFAATQGGLFRSADRGSSWERRNRGLQGQVLSMAFAAAPKRTIYLTTTVNIFRSTDAGANWKPLTGPGPQATGAYSVVAEPGNAATVYAGTFFKGVMKSVDGGETWDQFSIPGCQAAWSLVMDPRHPATLYAGCAFLPVFKSVDGGATWKAKSSGLPAADRVFAETHLAIVPDAPDTLYASTHLNGVPEVFRSRDGGDHWERVGPGGYPVTAGRSGAVLAGAHRSTDGGSTWTQVGALPSTAPLYAIDPADPRIVYVSSTSVSVSGGISSPFGVMKSLDGGATWAPSNRGLLATHVQALALAPGHPSILHSYVSGIGLHTLALGSGRWEKADTEIPEGRETVDWESTLRVDPATPSTVYYGWPQGLARSTDSGVTWSRVEPVNGDCIGVRDFAIDPRSPSTLVAVGALSRSCDFAQLTCTVFRSTDAGAAWKCAALPVAVPQRVVIDPAEPSRLYVISFEEVWRTDDRGAHWRRLRRGLSLAYRFTALAVDPKNPKQLYLSASSKLFKSTDRGETWTEQSRGLPAGGSIRALVVNPETPRIVYAGTDAGVFISGNSGRTWFPMNGGLPGFNHNLLLDPMNPNKLYAASAGNGVYTYERRP